MKIISVLSGLSLTVLLLDVSSVNAAPSNLNTPCIAATGIDYPVGPGQSYPNLAAVPWENLGPGDTVRIHYRQQPYREKIILSTSGTEAAPIRVCGVAGNGGLRPIIDGENAVNDPDDSAAYGSYTPMQGLALILIYNRNYTTKVNNIVIDGLHIRNAKNTFTYTRTDGTTSSYESGAACIRVQAGDNIVIRDNEIENCASGIFTMSQGYNEESLTRNILIEGNYIHGHGTQGSYLHHGMYIQAIGATYQYNRFGPMATGAQSVTIKERVAGSVIRYNWFDPGSNSRYLDLVEVEDAAAWYIVEEYLDSLNGATPDPQRLQRVQEAEAMYRETFVYGNFFNHVGSLTDAGNLVHYGWDNDISLAREGTLYFYNNSISIREDRSDSWRFRLFDMRNDPGSSSMSAETIEAFNNIIYLRSETAGQPPPYFCMTNNGGTVNFGVNWISNFSLSENLANCYYNDTGNQPTLNGLSNLIHGDNTPPPLDGNMLTINTPLVTGNAQDILSVVGVDHLISKEYLIHQSQKPRTDIDDLGAMAVPQQEDGIFSDGFEVPAS